MASTSLLKSSPVDDKSEFVKGQSLHQSSASVIHCHPISAPSLTIRATSSYADEIVKTAKTIASPGRGILAMDESNSTCGKRLASIGLENTEANRQAYRTLLVTAPGLGQTDSTPLVPFSLKRPSTNSQLMSKKWLMFLLNKTLFLVSKLTRVWFPLLVQMMSHGANVSMVLPHALLLTTNKELALPNGVP